MIDCQGIEKDAVPLVGSRGDHQGKGGRRQPHLHHSHGQRQVRQGKKNVMKIFANGLNQKKSFVTPVGLVRHQPPPVTEFFITTLGIIFFSVCSPSNALILMYRKNSIWICGLCLVR